ncbi:MAG: prepilin-type N-terminal cleavage/methylation domain-containing protein [Planctomycetota bacterium]
MKSNPDRIGDLPRHSGFTMAEMLVVMTIIIILAAMGFSAIHAARISTKKTTTLTLLKAVYHAAELYKEEYGRYPTVQGDGFISRGGSGVQLLDPSACFTAYLPVHEDDMRANTALGVKQLIDAFGQPIRCSHPFWEPSHLYNTGEWVRPKDGGPFLYRAIAQSGNSGNSGAAEPTWPTGSVGDTVPDNELTWRLILTGVSRPLWLYSLGADEQPEPDGSWHDRDTSTGWSTDPPKAQTSRSNANADNLYLRDGD